MLQYIDEIKVIIQQIKTDLQQNDFYTSTKNSNQSNSMETMPTSAI